MRLTRMVDVAKEAGLSVATVSRVIQNKGYASSEARAAVLRAAKSLDYHFDRTAQSLRSRKSHIIGHIAHNSYVNPFFAHVSAGVEQGAAGAGFSVITCFTSDSASEASAVRLLVERRVDAVLFTTIRDRRNLKPLLRQQIPVVLVERTFDMPEVDRVIVDNKYGAMEATRHLLELGHRRIAFLGGVTGVEDLASVERERYDGYAEAMQLRGVTVDPDLVRRDAYAVESGRAMTGRLLDQAAVTAIFASGDQLALGALQELASRGLSVPGDISVVGFDDTLAKFAAPPMTTVVQPMEEMGQMAAHLATDRPLEKYSGPGRTLLLRTFLVVRDSTGPPRGGPAGAAVEGG